MRTNILRGAALAALLALAGCGSDAVTYETPSTESQQLDAPSARGRYGVLQVLVLQIDGVDVPCVLSSDGGVTCDWERLRLGEYEP